MQLIEKNDIANIKNQSSGNLKQMPDEAIRDNAYFKRALNHQANLRLLIKLGKAAKLNS